MIYMYVPYMAPSVNEAYFVRGGRKHITKTGESFKRNVSVYLTQNYPKEMCFFEKNVPYLIAIRCFFKKLQNDGWPKKTQVRYKTLDASNRLKLTEDAFKTAVGVDDSQFLTVCVTKALAPPDKPEAFDVWAINLEQERSPLDEYVRNSGA
jgi:hypothetical protein